MLVVLNKVGIVVPLVVYLQKILSDMYIGMCIF